MSCSDTTSRRWHRPSPRRDSSKTEPARPDRTTHPPDTCTSILSPARARLSTDVPAAGFTTTAAATFEGINIASGTVLTAFDVTAASVGCPAGNPTCSSPWEAQDQDVIGAGAYKFVHWEAGNFVRLDKNPYYFIPDSSVAAKTLQFGLRVPKVDSIVYRLYRNVQATVFALQAGTLDFIDWAVPPDQVAPITADPNIGLKSSADAGFFYQSFNFQRLPFGYINPAQWSIAP